MCPLILCFLYFAVSRILSSLYRFIDVFDAQMAVVDVGINFFLVSFNTFLIISCFCLLETWMLHGGTIQILSKIIHILMLAGYVINLTNDSD